MRLCRVNILSVFPRNLGHTIALFCIFSITFFNLYDLELLSRLGRSKFYGIYVKECVNFFRSSVVRRYGLVAILDQSSTLLLANWGINGVSVWLLRDALHHATIFQLEI